VEHSLQDLQAILKALDSINKGTDVFQDACQDAGIKPIFDPFWQKLPYSNIYCSITPDILHQLYQGILKHLKSWLLSVYAVMEIDA
jgi:hypothetical protein